LRPDPRYDLALSMRTKSSGTLRTLPNTVNGKFYTDSEPAQEEELSSAHHPQSLDNGVFRFDLNETNKSPTINNKMPLVKSLQTLRKFKVGLSPRRKLKIVDDRLDPSGSNRVFQEVYDYERIHPKSHSYGPSTPVCMPTSHPHQQSKNVVIKVNNRAVALAPEAQGIPTLIQPVSRSSTASSHQDFELQQLPVALNAKDSRSYDDSNLGPLCTATRRTPQSLSMAPLLDLALAQSSESDSFTIDSYREEQREHFLQHNISRSEDDFTRSRTHSRASASLTGGADTLGSVTRAELPGGSVVRRPKKYAGGAEDLVIRSDRPHTTPSDHRPVTPKEVLTVPNVPLAQTLSFRM